MSIKVNEADARKLRAYSCRACQRLGKCGNDITAGEFCDFSKTFAAMSGVTVNVL